MSSAEKKHYSIDTILFLINWISLIFAGAHLNANFRTKPPPINLSHSILYTVTCSKLKKSNIIDGRERKKEK